MNKYINSTIAAMRGYTPGEQPTDPRIIKLNTNESPYPPSPAVLEVLRAGNPEALRLYPDPLCAKLRQTIATLHEVQPENIFIGNGSDEILALCTKAFVEDNGVIGYFEPSYSLYPVLVRIRAVAAAAVPLGVKFEWNMPAGYQANLFFMTTPNAPTGIQYPQAQIAEFCQNLAGVVVLDEAYVDFAETSCIQLGRTLDNTIILRTLSKSYALAGLRLGYAVGPAPLIEALLKIKDSYNVSRLTQAIAHAALLDQAYMHKMVGQIKATRRETAAMLTELGFQVFDSATNFLWAKPSRIKAENYYRLLRGQNIIVRHFAGERTADYVRITIGTPQQMNRLLEATKNIMTENTL